jgi:heme/copper-type cytochrome/quinol oxidase subunit 1
MGLTALGIILGACIRSSTTLVPAHYHAALGGVTAAAMAAAYLLVERGSRAPRAYWRAARRQLIAFGLGQAVFALGFAWGGAYGLGRKTYSTEQHVRTIGEKLALGTMGLGGLVAAAAGVVFLVLVLRAWRRTAPSISA